ncbi:Smc hinge domain-containing protein [Rhizopogon salebrosus TDB-379]|nr:Smc hinge domain-containing protein [Rhizopogon salebrosus TDB-379]
MKTWSGTEKDCVAKRKLSEPTSRSSKKRLTTLQGDLTRSKQDRLETETNEKLADVYQRLLQAGVDRNESERERIFPGVRGRVIGLCKPTQRKYETAVSGILGRNIDAVIVDEEKIAIECIDYIRTQRAGQATFLPLDAINTKPINDKFRLFAKGARLAVDVIQYESAVERAMLRACGNALVCDTMEVARCVCWERGQEVNEWAYYWWAQYAWGGKKWEEKDVQALTHLCDNLVAQLQELNRSKPRGKVDENIAEIARLESAITIARDDLGACNSRYNGIRDEIKHLERELKKLSPVVQQIHNSSSVAWKGGEECVVNVSPHEHNLSPHEYEVATRLRERYEFEGEVVDHERMSEGGSIH